VWKLWCLEKQLKELTLAYHSAYAAFAAFRTFAHRAFWAAAILARASGETMRFFAVMGVGAVFGLGPRFAFVVVAAVPPERMLFTCSRRAISESIWAMISLVSIAQFYAQPPFI
jgi:hypothetical protein